MAENTLAIPSNVNKLI